MKVKTLSFESSLSNCYTACYSSGPFFKSLQVTERLLYNHLGDSTHICRISTTAACPSFPKSQTKTIPNLLSPWTRPQKPGTLTICRDRNDPFYYVVRLPTETSALFLRQTQDSKLLSFPPTFSHLKEDDRMLVQHSNRPRFLVADFRGQTIFCPSL